MFRKISWIYLLVLQISFVFFLGISLFCFRYQYILIYTPKFLIRYRTGPAITFNDYNLLLSNILFTFAMQIDGRIASQKAAYCKVQLLRQSIQGLSCLYFFVLFRNHIYYCLKRSHISINIQLIFWLHLQYLSNTYRD